MRKTVRNRRGLSRAVFTCVLFLILLTVTLLAYFAKKYVEKPQNMRSSVLYQKDGNSYFWSQKSKESVRIPLHEESVICYSRDGKVLAFTALAADSSGVYDLYYCDTAKQKSPRILQHGITNALQMSGDGRLLYYTAQSADNSPPESFCYRVEEERSILIAANIQSVYPSRHHDLAYFTQKTGGKLSLWRFTGNTEQTEKLADNVKTVKLFSCAEQTRVFYEVPAQGGTVLYTQTQGSEVQQVAQQMAKALYENYEPGNEGILYYLSQDDSGRPDWHTMFTDRNALTDHAMNEPKKEDYLSVFGFSPEYNRAVEQYQKKQARDLLRAALQQVLETAYYPQSSHALYAYQNGESRLVAAGLSEQTLYSVCAATPLALVRIFESKAQQQDVEALAKEAEGNNEQEMRDYAFGMLESAVQLSGYSILRLEGTRATLSEALPFSVSDNSSFTFSRDGAWLYAITVQEQGSRKEIYACSAADSGGQAERLVSTVSRVQSEGDALLALCIPEGEQSGSLQRIQNGKAAVQAEGVTEMQIAGQDILLFGGADKQLRLLQGGKEKQLNSDVSPGDVAFSGGQNVFYLKQDGGQQGKTLCFYNGKKSITVDSLVEKLVAE